MKFRGSSKASSNSGRELGEVLQTDAAVYFILTLVVLLSYGYEIFNFNLTIDEELHAQGMVMWTGWVGQGRWGMALLNYLLVPNPIVPVVSLFVGVLGLIVGVSSLLKSLFVLDRLGLAALTALAITIPTLSFSFTFSTLAYGIGVGFVALAGANWLLFRGGWKSVAIASLLAGFAIGIYQTFIFVMVMIAIVQVCRACTIENINGLAVIKKPAIFVLGGGVSYVLINWGMLKVLHVDLAYVGQFIDIQGLIQNPMSRLSRSFHRWWEIISLIPSDFGIRSIWLSCLILVSLTMALVYPLFKRNYRTATGMAVMTITMVSVMVIADAIALRGAPLRSLVYIPLGIVIIVACAYTVSGKGGRYLLVLLCGLTVIGNSQVSNHLFLSSASAEFQDRALAQVIINEVRSLKPDNLNGMPFKLDIIGNHSHFGNGILSKSEHLGASFFEWDGGNRWRVASFLNLNGLVAIGASDEDRAHVYEQVKSMPSWPYQGWIAVKNDIVILKFGDYSAPQRNSLCAQKIAELCDKT